MRTLKQNSTHLQYSVLPNVQCIKLLILCNLCFFNVSSSGSVSGAHRRRPVFMTE